MYPVRDEYESRRIVTFYAIYTIVYFPIVMLTLYLSGGILTMGKYSFQSVLFVIVFAEIMKYISSSIYFKERDIASYKKNDINSHTVVKSFFNKPKLRQGFKVVLTVIVMTLTYFAVSILYGAEIFVKHEETLMFSALLSVLTVFPICVNLTPLSVVLALLGCKAADKVELLMYQNLYLTLFGAWLGAFVIPLDWDRPWQEWPIPCSCGALVGYLVSHFVMIFRIRMFR